ncbi:YchJ family protein [Leifsonia sp. A12D58]|uniref:YchJ family protein n=1 Tax=Leifsonia sp. A12D58 TaxID=3397674 RepID=UPI0039E032CB
MTSPLVLDQAGRCPCLSGEVYGACCGPLHSGAAAAPTAERLMRSRFTAFACHDNAYLLSTWAASTRPASLEFDADIRWTRLDILRTERGGMLDTVGIVEFRAYYRIDREPREPRDQHEVSTFSRENGRWVYEGEL